MARIISISTCCHDDIGILEQIDEIADAGFNCISFCSDYKRTGILDPDKRSILKERMILREVVVDTIHGPSVDDPKCIEKCEELLTACEFFGAKILVLHTNKGFEVEEDELNAKIEVLLSTCVKLMPKLREIGVRVAIENLHPGFATDIIRYTLNKLDEKCFGLCYDSSHDQVDGPRSYEFLETYRDRVIAVHLSDRIRPFVDHAIPGEGFVDFEVIAKHLKMAGYQRSVLLELLSENSEIKDRTMYLRQAHIKGKEIAEMIGDELPFI